MLIDLLMLVNGKTILRNTGNLFAVVDSKKFPERKQVE